MAPADGPAPAGAARPRGAGRDTARTRAVPPPQVRSWFEREPALGAAGWRAARRLARRSRASWPLWLGAALLISGALTARLAWAPVRYEVTTVLRVSEGALDASGSNLNGGALRAHVNERAFKSEHLIAVMKRRPEWFGASLANDPEQALTGFRSAMDVAFSENGFIEDRGAGDPPRAARIAITFRARTPEAAWTIAHDLTDLVIGSTLEGQRAQAEREVAAATESLRRTQDDLSRAVREDPLGKDPRVRAARERWRSAQSAASAATTALHADTAQQTLHFELVDPGRKPENQRDLEPLVTRFVVAFLVTILAGWLLAGAFDPRVLDADDVEMVGLSVLGRLPLLPIRPASSAPSTPSPAGEGSRQRPRV